MDSPAVIEAKIDELKNQLKESRKYFKYEYICDHNYNTENEGNPEVKDGTRII
jgi:hypothetical protein